MTCAEKHTALAPAKNSVRQGLFSPIPRHNDIITISHGAFDVLMNLSWHGKVIACDIDPGTRELIRKLRKMYKRDYVTSLDIQEPGKDIVSTVIDYCIMNGVDNLGFVDVDLAFSVNKAAKIFGEVVRTLAAFGYKGEIALTFFNGRERRYDGKKMSLEKRLEIIRKELPDDSELSIFSKYHSDNVDKHGNILCGCSMCVVKASVPNAEPTIEGYKIAWNYLLDVIKEKKIEAAISARARGRDRIGKQLKERFAIAERSTRAKYALSRCEYELAIDLLRKQFKKVGY